MAPADDSTIQRLERIESALAHLQHDLDAINQSLTLQYQRLQGFEHRFSKIESELESLQEDPEVRDPDAERPPHY